MYINCAYYYNKKQCDNVCRCIEPIVYLKESTTYKATCQSEMLQVTVMKIINYSSEN